MAEHMIKTLGKREVWPVIVNPDQLDAVAPVRRRGGGELRLEQAYGLIAGGLKERFEALRR